MAESCRSTFICSRTNARIRPVADMTAGWQIGAMKIAPFSLLGIGAAVVACSSASSANPTLCELAQNREAYAGRTLTVEGRLLVSRHGSAIEDPRCDDGIRMEWFEGEAPGFRELNAVAEHAQTERLEVILRVTGVMMRAGRSELVNEPYWYLRLRTAQVLSVEADRE